MATQEAQLDSEATDNGWQLAHAQEAVSADNSGSGVAEAGHYIALKRDAASAGDSPVELAAQSIDSLNEMIADYERSRPVPEDEQPEPTKEQVEASIAGTAEQLVSSGARPIDVEALTEEAVEATDTVAAEKAEGAGKPKAAAAKP